MKEFLKAFGMVALGAMLMLLALNIRVSLLSERVSLHLDLIHGVQTNVMEMRETVGMVVTNEEMLMFANNCQSSNVLMICARLAALERGRVLNSRTLSARPASKPRPRPALDVAAAQEPAPPVYAKERADFSFYGRGAALLKCVVIETDTHTGEPLSKVLSTNSAPWPPCL